MADQILAAPRIVLQSGLTPEIRRAQAVIAALEVIRAGATNWTSGALDSAMKEVSTYADCIEAALKSE